MPTLAVAAVAAMAPKAGHKAPREKFCARLSGGDICEFIWLYEITRVTSNPNGSTGWASVARCSGDQMTIGKCEKISQNFTN